MGRFMNARTKVGAKEDFEQKKQGVSDTLEYCDTKMQLNLHAYDEGKRNILEFKRLTLNRLRNIDMLKSCWNKLSKRIVNWREIRVAIEDQLTVERNWNLHPSNPNPDMAKLKEAYWLGEENHLGKTGQVRMEVTAPVGNARVIYATANPAPTQSAIFLMECEDTLNTLGNCNAWYKPRYVKRDCLEKTKAQTSYNRELKREFNCYFLTIYYF